MSLFCVVVIGWDTQECFDCSVGDDTFLLVVFEKDITLSGFKILELHICFLCVFLCVYGLYH